MNIQRAGGSGATGLAVSGLLSRVGAGGLLRGGLVIAGKESARWSILPDWRWSETLRTTSLPLALCAGIAVMRGVFSQCPRPDRELGPCCPCTDAECPPRHPSVLLLAWVISLGACPNSAVLGVHGDPKARA